MVNPKNRTRIAEWAPQVPNQRPHVQRPRGAPSTSSGWDLGRNDHTESLDDNAPRSLRNAYLARVDRCAIIARIAAIPTPTTHTAAMSASRPTGPLRGVPDAGTGAST